MTFLFAQFDRDFAVCHPFFYARFISTKVVVCLNVYVYGQLLIQHIVPLSKAVHSVQQNQPVCDYYCENIHDN